MKSVLYITGLLVLIMLIFIAVRSKKQADKAKNEAYRAKQKYMDLKEGESNGEEPSNRS
ncbi:hypothetical protein ACOAKC_01055 [Hathewaya histolytica]|uniref:hypothetical protein n=1 Tax=Hathewaya histolytica TaxID=1498 RepID=UPI003B67759E